MSNSPDAVPSLAARIAAAAGGAGVITESIIEYTIHGVLDEETSRLLSVFATAAAQQRFADVNVQDRFGEAVPIENIAATRGTVDVFIRKPNTLTTFYFFEGARLEALFADDASMRCARRVRIASGIAPFQTEQCSFDHWTVAVPDAADAPAQENVELRLLVADLSPDRRVPSSIGNLLLASPAPASPALRAWEQHAARTLPCVLVKEVRENAGSDVLVLTSPRRVYIPAPDGTVPDATVLSAELDAARWIYASGPGVENRLTFFTTELSRSWPETATWNGAFANAGPSALEAARAAQRLFLSGKTAEVLKALGDLRKALTDEGSKVMQQSRDLSSSLWRDFAIAIAALAARVAAGANSLTSQSFDLPISLLLGFVCAFLAYSLFVTLTSNWRFLAAAKSSRETWTRKTYGFLQQAELDELSSAPMAEVENVYKWTAWRVGTAYVMVIAVLVVVAVLPLFGVHKNASSNAANSATSAARIPTSDASTGIALKTGAEAQKATILGKCNALSNSLIVWNDQLSTSALTTPGLGGL